MPCSGQSPGDFQPNSVVVVLPRMTAPACFSPITAGASSAAGSAEVVWLPRRVGKPGEVQQVLHRARHAVEQADAAGRPSSAPRSRPAATTARGFITAKAFTHGL